MKPSFRKAGNPASHTIVFAALRRAAIPMVLLATTALAGCATDDLVGWTERKDGESTRHAGYLDGFELSRQDAEAMIMAARVSAGWIEAPAALEEPEAEGETAEA